MANFVLNASLGRIAEIVDDGADLQVIPMSASDTDANNLDLDPQNITAFFTPAGNTEQTTGGWSRKTITNGTITVTVDHASDLVKVILPDQTWTAPTAGNDTVDIVIAEDTNVDGTDRVLTQHDFVVTADGNDVTADFDATNGFWQST